MTSVCHCGIAVPGDGGGLLLLPGDLQSATQRPLVCNSLSCCVMVCWRLAGSCAAVASLSIWAALVCDLVCWDLRSCGTSTREEQKLMPEQCRGQSLSQLFCHRPVERRIDRKPNILGKINQPLFRCCHDHGGTTARSTEACPGNPDTISQKT